MPDEEPTRPKKRAKVRQEGSKAQRGLYAVTEYRENKEHQKKVQEEFWHYVHSTTFVIPSPHITDVEYVHDAANECKHGWLPTDKKKDCDCW